MLNTKTTLKILPKAGIYGTGENCASCEWIKQNMSFEIRKAAEIWNNPLASVIYFYFM